VAQRPRAALFLVRAWWEDGEFRARVTYSVEITSEVHQRTVTADAAEIHRILAVWLHEAAAHEPESGADANASDDSE